MNFNSCRVTRQKVKSIPAPTAHSGPALKGSSLEPQAQAYFGTYLLTECRSCCRSLVLNSNGIVSFVSQIGSMLK